MLAWTSWRLLPLRHAFTQHTLEETLDGGQAFRWNRFDTENYWQGVWGNRVARLRLSAEGALFASVPARDSSEAMRDLQRFLGHDQDWDKILDALPWRSDPHLALCLHAFRGLRILKQPFPEAVLCFLCSATKQIPQIKLMCDRLAETLGSEIIDGIHALPTWEQLAAASESELRALGLGFRAKNIKKTADLLASQPGLLQHIEQSSYRSAKSELTALPGIGEKIADCALLFGAAKLEAFPVDTWIIKVLEKRYQLLGWTPAQLAQFGRIHFGPYAGFAQQFLFSFERAFRES